MEHKPVQSPSQCKYIALIIPVIILMFVGFKLMISHKLAVSVHNRKAYKSPVDDLRLAQVETLVLAQVLFRHGSRTPLRDYKRNVHKDYMKIYGVKGLGQLTPLGVDQTCKLGHYLRNRYDGFLSKQYSFDEVYVQSSDVDRTIMSALSLLQGLFPVEIPQKDYTPDPGEENCARSTWQPIPVHVLSNSVDNKIHFSKKCAKSDRLYAEFLKSPELTKLNEENQLLYKCLENKSGQNVTFFEDLYFIYDTLLINKFYGLPLPDWTEEIFPEKMAEIANIVFKMYTPTEEMKRLYMGPFLEEIITNMDVKLNCTSVVVPEDYPRAKLYLYSGHDTTISSLLNVFELYDGLQPPYTAALLIEMHRLGESVFVKVFYRPDQTNDTVELTLPKCGQPCTLEKFKEAYAQYWKSLSDGGWEAECSREEETKFNF